jgi:hypothetical protein
VIFQGESSNVTENSYLVTAKMSMELPVKRSLVYVNNDRGTEMLKSHSFKIEGKDPNITNTD